MPGFKRKIRKVTIVRKKRKTNATRRIAKIAKKVMLSASETKRYLKVSGTQGLSLVNLPDNVSRWCINNCMALPQGNEDSNAIGSQIQAVGISLKIQFNYTAPYAPYFKLFVVEANADLLGGENSIFEHTIGNGMLDNIKKQYKILKSITVNPMMRGAGGSGTHGHKSVPIFRKLWIPLNKKYDFRTDGLINGVNKNIAVCAIGYYEGALTTLSVGGVHVFSTLYYKDP